MPRFFFTFRDADQMLPDPEGIEFADSFAARREAVLIVGDLLDKRSGTLPDEWKDWSLTIRDAAGRLIFDLPFAAAVKLAIASRPRGATAGQRRVVATANVVPLRLARVHRRFTELRKQMRARLREREGLVARNQRATQQLNAEIKAAREAIARSRALLDAIDREAGRAPRCPPT